MKINVICEKQIRDGLVELSKEFDFELAESNDEVFFIKSNRNFVSFVKGDIYKIEYTEKVYAFRLFVHVLTRFKFNRHFDYNFEFEPKIEYLTYMLDCSRNAVMKNDSIKKLIRYLASMGYNRLMLYTEDTYEVKKYPYFGYLRNRFTKDDIKEIEEYCDLFGIELIPCIQTLAHFNAITRYPSMSELFDCDDILLIGEEKTYEFIEELIKTCREYFKTNIIHIGMDEAHNVGRGKYLDKNGYHDRLELMNYHVKRVLEICKKYDFNAMIWSDMYASLLDEHLNVNVEKLNDMPKDVELTYWDYYSTDVNHFEMFLNIHKMIGNKYSFAGGAWKWIGFTPDNRYSLKEIEASMRACMNTNTYHYILTGWGDNGGETSPFDTLPSLYFASLMRFDLLKLDQDINNLMFNDEFKLLSDGLNFSEFMALDLNNRLTNNNDVNERNTSNRYLLYNDPLLGVMDSTIDENCSKIFSEHVKEFESINYKNTKFSYLFDTQYRLAKVLSIKSRIGIELRNHYKSNDKEALKSDLDKLKTLLTLLDDFYNSFDVKWNIENRSNGIDVFDLREGALERRVKRAINLVESYLDKLIDSIPELEEEILDYFGNDKDLKKEYDIYENRWRRISSVNVND